MVKKGAKLREQVINVAVLFYKMAVSNLALPALKPLNRKKSWFTKVYTIRPQIWHKYLL